jgi:hypothetical protein
VQNFAFWQTDGWVCRFSACRAGNQDGITAQKKVWNEEEQRIYEHLGPVFDAGREWKARALASGPLGGKKEFELRDQVHGLGAKSLGIVADKAAKKGDPLIAC